MVKEKIRYLSKSHGEQNHYPPYIMRGILSSLRIKWPGITEDIKKYVLNCVSCQFMSPNQTEKLEFRKIWKSQYETFVINYT
jgi:hypothetical protein